MGLLLTTESGDLTKLGEAKGREEEGFMSLPLPPPPLVGVLHKKDEDADLLLYLLWFLGLSEVP